MHKIVQALFFLILVSTSLNFLSAQNLRINKSNTQQQGNFSDLDQKNSNQRDQKKTIYYNTGAPSKRDGNPKEASSNTDESLTNKTITTDKYLNPPANRFTTEEKSSEDKQQTNEKTGNSNNETGIVTALDLQVTATKEVTPISSNTISERKPGFGPTSNNSAVDNATPKTEPADNKPETKIGKVEFLKQYVIELKTQIEKNKNNPDYPLAAKQKELEDLENLLK